jgi:very-short-patch-repair endonuclease
MTPTTTQAPVGSPWALTASQHGVVARRQLLKLGLGSEAISHRIRTGRLHPVRRGVYAVGRRQLTRQGRWMAAVLSCGAEAALSHDSAAVVWEILPAERLGIEVSVPTPRDPRRPGIVVHRRRCLRPEDITVRNGIPLTTPLCTLVDIAGTLTSDRLEAAINEADKHDLIDPEALRSALDAVRARPGLKRLRATLDRSTFVMTDTELERRFLPIARRAGLPRPQTQRYVNGFRVDFYWPELGLVVETDGLRYHRTPAEQSRDRLRDQAHTAAGLTCLRFTNGQVRSRPGHVEETLSAVARRLR